MWNDLTKTGLVAEGDKTLRAQCDGGGGEVGEATDNKEPGCKSKSIKCKLGVVKKRG